MDFRKGKGREELEINLIPFIDVLLVILIFMMVTTTYSKYNELKITLPTADAEKAAQRPFQIDVGVTEAGRYSINGVQVAANDAPTLAEEMKRAAAEKGEEGKDPTVIISADMRAQHQSVINVLQASRLAGYDKVTFSTEASGRK